MGPQGYICLHVFANLGLSAFYPLATQKAVPTAAQAAAPGPAPSLAATPPQARPPPPRTSATGITVELLKTRGLAGLYRGAGATLMRSYTPDMNTLSPTYSQYLKYLLLMYTYV